MLPVLQALNGQKTSEHRSGVFYLWVEFLLLFGGTPLLLLACRKAGLLFLVLWAGGLVCARASRATAPLPDLRLVIRRLAWLAPPLTGLAITLATNQPLTPQQLAWRASLRSILVRFALIGSVLAALTAKLAPAHFLALPRLHPFLWLMIMLLYPLLSVWPQEIIYRRFLHWRYGPIFGQGAGFIAASAGAFGFAHIIFLNVLAVTTTLAGGLLFAHSYRQQQSVWLVFIEHSLYGCLIFTLGLGQYFYTGTAWH